MDRKRLPCPRCGNPKTIGIFCKECLQAVHPLVKSVKPASVVLCANCERSKPHSDWKRIPDAELLPTVLSPSLTFSQDASVTSVEFGDAKIERKPGLQREVRVLAIVTGHHEDAPKDYEEEYDIPLSYSVTLCPHCKKRGTAYYEGILQVRHQTPAVRKAIQEYFVQQRSKGLRLAKEVPVGSGSDYYISDHRAINHLAKLLHGRFGGELRVSAQHFSYDHSAGKNLYRVNAYLEIPEYSKGDVIRRDDQYHYVLGVSQNVKAENLLTGEQENYPYRHGEAARLPIKRTTVASVRPLSVINPVTYQAVTPLNSKYAPIELDIDQEVSVAIDGKYLFLIPGTEEKEAPKRKRQRHSQKRKKKDDDLINPN